MTTGPVRVRRAPARTRISCLPSSPRPRSTPSSVPWFDVSSWRLRPRGVTPTGIAGRPWQVRVASVLPWMGNPHGPGSGSGVHDRPAPPGPPPHPPLTATLSWPADHTTSLHPLTTTFRASSAGAARQVLPRGGDSRAADDDALDHGLMVCVVGNTLEACLCLPWLQFASLPPGMALCQGPCIHTPAPHRDVHATAGQSPSSPPPTPLARSQALAVQVPRRRLPADLPGAASRAPAHVPLLQGAHAGHAAGGERGGTASRCSADGA